MKRSKFSSLSSISQTLIQYLLKHFFRRPSMAGISTMKETRKSLEIKEECPKYVLSNFQTKAMF